MTFHQKVWRPEDSGMNNAFIELKKHKQKLSTKNYISSGNVLQKEKGLKTPSDHEN